MNIIFLDVDGVLNSLKYLNYYCELTNTKSYNGINYPFDPECLSNLKKIVEATQAKIVVTSTWRKKDSNRMKLLEVLKEYDLDKEVVGWTPVLGTSTVGPTRGHEIYAYLTTMLNWPQNFVILDDANIYMDDYLPHLIKINGYNGLTEENVKEAITKLCSVQEADYIMAKKNNL